MVNQSGRIATYLITSSSDDTSSDTDSNTDTDTDTDDEDISDTETTLVQEEEMAEELASLINSYRSENGLSTLTVSSTLNSYAMIRAEELYTTGIGHTRPDGSTAYSSWGIAGEICTITTGGASSALSSFQNSSEHNSIMLSNGCTQIGVGCTSYSLSSSTTCYLWCVLFN